MVGEHAVGERDLGAGALQQRPRDEHAEPEPAMLALGVVGLAPARQIGLADPLEDVGRKARPVVGNHDFDGFVVPPRIHLDLVAREIDGIFQDVADAIEDRRIARADRLLAAGDRDPHLDGDAEIAMRRHRLLDQRRELHAVERRAGRRQLGDLGQDVAAALRLLAQGLDVAGRVGPLPASVRSSSRETSTMVDSGVPSSCAAAAASPSSWVRCCSRASTSSVAASASDSLRASSVTWNA